MCSKFGNLRWIVLSGARIFKLLRGPRIDSKEPTPRFADLSLFTGYCISWLLNQDIDVCSRKNVNWQIGQKFKKISNSGRKDSALHSWIINIDSSHSTVISQALIYITFYLFSCSFSQLEQLTRTPLLTLLLLLISMTAPFSAKKSKKLFASFKFKPLHFWLWILESSPRNYAPDAKGAAT